MMDMKINGGSFKITDDNRTVTSKNVADEIYRNYIVPDKYNNDDSIAEDRTSSSTYKLDIDIEGD